MTACGAFADAGTEGPSISTTASATGLPGGGPAVMVPFTAACSFAPAAAAASARPSAATARIIAAPPAPPWAPVAHVDRDGFPRLDHDRLLANAELLVPDAQRVVSRRHVADLVFPRRIGDGVVGVVGDDDIGAHPGVPDVARDRDEPGTGERLAHAPPRRERDVEQRVGADARIGVVQDGVAVAQLEPLADLGRLDVRLEAAAAVVEVDGHVPLGPPPAVYALDAHDGVAKPTRCAHHEAVVGHAVAAHLAMLVDGQRRARGNRAVDAHRAGHHGGLGRGGRGGRGGQGEHDARDRGEARHADRDLQTACRASGYLGGALLRVSRYATMSSSCWSVSFTLGIFASGIFDLGSLRNARSQSASRLRPTSSSGPPSFAIFPPSPAMLWHVLQSLS